jgi:hypothetical protein
MVPRNKSGTPVEKNFKPTSSQTLGDFAEKAALKVSNS